jgi:hypothetical protein
MRAAKISGWRLVSALFLIPAWWLRRAHMCLSFCFSCFFSAVFVVFVVFYSVLCLFDRLSLSSIRSLKRAGHLLLCRCYSSYTVNWLTEYRFMFDSVHMIRTVIIILILIDIVVDVVVVLKRIEYVWLELERLNDLPCFLAIFYTCNLRPTLVLSTGNAAAAYHVPTSLPLLPHVLPWRLGG